MLGGWRVLMISLIDGCGLVERCLRTNDTPPRNKYGDYPEFGSRRDWRLLVYPFGRRVAYPMITGAGGLSHARAHFLILSVWTLRSDREEKLAEQWPKRPSHASCHPSTALRLLRFPLPGLVQQRTPAPAPGKRHNRSRLGYGYRRASLVTLRRRCGYEWRSATGICISLYTQDSIV